MDKNSLEIQRRANNYKKNINIFYSLLMYCATHKDFSIGVYVSNRVMLEFAGRLIADCVNDIKEMFDYIPTVDQIRMHTDANTRLIDFQDTASQVKVMVAADSMRGQKFNFVVIDNCISEDIVDYIIFPALRDQLDENLKPIIHPLNYIELEF